MFALVLTALPEVKSALKGGYVVNLFSYLQGKKQKIPLGFLNEFFFFCLSYYQRKGRIQMHLWWKHTTEEKVSFGKPPCSWQWERKEMVAGHESCLLKLYVHSFKCNENNTCAFKAYHT